MIHVVVVDDELMARNRLQRLLAAIPDVECTACFEDGEALIDYLQQRETPVIDVLLLDVQMPGLTGVDIGGLLPENGPDIIFVTAHEQHAVKAFSLGAIDYVVKPVTPERLKQALQRARSRREPQQTTHHKIPIKTHKGIVLLDIDEISHASYDGILVTVYLHDNTQDITTESTLTDLEERLANAGFLRVHRRHLLQLDSIARLEPIDSGGYTAHMQRGDAIPVSRQAARKLRKLLHIN